jgi:7-cyano-7-deazaguanine reductase
MNLSKDERLELIRLESKEILTREESELLYTLRIKTIYMKDNVENLKNLGSHGTKYEYENPTKEMLETFKNQYPNRDYITEFVFNEFSSLCPKTGQPDFAKITIHYIPNKLCIETKSLKVYFLAYRQEKTFMETLTNRILDDCVAVCKPRYMRVTSEFNPRGGTLISVVVEYDNTK